MRFADDVLLFSSAKEQLRKMLSEVQKKWDLESIQDRQKTLSNQSLNIRQEFEIDDIKVEILTREESTKYLGVITFQQETTEIRNRIRAAWATFHKCRQELTSKIYMLKTSTSAFRRSGNPDDELRIRNMDTHTRARENDSVEATQNA